MMIGSYRAVAPLFMPTGIDRNGMKGTGRDAGNKEKNSNVTFGDTWSSPVFNQQIKLIFHPPCFYLCSTVVTQSSETGLKCMCLCVGVGMSYNLHTPC